MISITNYNKANNFENTEKGKPKRGRRPNAVKNYASLINNSDGEEMEEGDFSKAESKKGRKNKGDVGQQ